MVSSMKISKWRKNRTFLPCGGPKEMLEKRFFVVGGSAGVATAVLVKIKKKIILKWLEKRLLLEIFVSLWEIPPKSGLTVKISVRRCRICPFIRRKPKNGLYNPRDNSRVVHGVGRNGWKWWAKPLFFDSGVLGECSPSTPLVPPSIWR